MERATWILAVTARSALLLFRTLALCNCIHLGTITIASPTITGAVATSRAIVRMIAGLLMESSITVAWRFFCTTLAYSILAIMVSLHVATLAEITCSFLL